jgi:hypothetical protein
VIVSPQPDGSAMETVGHMDPNIGILPFPRIGDPWCLPPTRLSSRSEPTEPRFRGPSLWPSVPFNP